MTNGLELNGTRKQRLLSALLGLFAVIAWQGCRETVSEVGTGETHFLANCDASCGAGLSCICGVCTKECDESVPCNDLDRAARCFAGTCSGAPKACDVPCKTDDDCRLVGQASVCSGGRCREQGTANPRPGREFSDCKLPPPSSCTFEETCAALDCGGLEFDEGGCRRAPCSSDADCGTGDRCTYLQCVDQKDCSYDFGTTCICGGNAACIPGLVCSAVAVVGPAGDWTTLEVRSTSGPCPPGATCTSWWRIGPDGGLAASKAGEPVTSRISDVDMRELRLLVDGPIPNLRVALRDGIPCDPPPTDIGITIRLELSTQTLERDVTGCVLSGPSGNVFQRIDQIVERY